MWIFYYRSKISQIDNHYWKYLYRFGESLGNYQLKAININKKYISNFKAYNILLILYSRVLLDNKIINKNDQKQSWNS